MRRTLAMKYQRIAALLDERDHPQLGRHEQTEIKRALLRTITEIWETDEIRRTRPTPLDEARAGMVVIEQSLWNVVPLVLRNLDLASRRHTGRPLPLDAAPITFGSWMGGDRDGNPNVTAEVTAKVCRQARGRALELYIEEIDALRRELSMRRCSDALRRVGATGAEPYRALLAAVLHDLRECAVRQPLRVVPLFERVEALAGAADCMERLFSIAWYAKRIRGRQKVMIGYSDSAKDAGQIAAAWSLYRAQEELVATARRHDVALTLFHGRGGTVARGGAPARAAILSQPPGSVNGSLRVTEQGEVIQAKYGIPSMARETLETYLAAVIEATVLPPPAPRERWREQMDRLGALAMEEFRSFVRGEADFVEYFRQATPEPELSRLTIGSRPARRGKGKGIGQLRAIPWIFAWTQTRLMLPAWLGVGKALRLAIEDGDLPGPGRDAPRLAVLPHHHRVHRDGHGQGGPRRRRALRPAPRAAAPASPRHRTTAPLPRHGGTTAQGQRPPGAA